MNAVPAAAVQLGDYATFLSGYPFESTSFNTDGDGVPVVRIRDVKRGRSTTFYSGSFDDRYLIEDGDYLIGMDGEFNLGRWAGGRAVLNQRVCKLEEVSDSLDLDYLARYLGLVLKQIEAVTPFVTVKHLSIKTLRAVPIPLPPLQQQRRIAKVLDAADELRAKRWDCLDHLRPLVSSVFLEMFGSPLGAGEKFPKAKLGSLARVVRGASPRPAGDPRYFGGSVPWLKIGDITAAEGRFVTTVKERVTEAGVKKSILVPAGTLVLTNSATVGVPKFLGVDACIHDGFLALLDLDDSRMDDVFLHATLELRRDQLARLAPEGTQKNLNTGIVKNLDVMLPPIALQRAFASRVRLIEAVEASARAHFRFLNTLFASLQSRAFAGEF